MKHLRNGKEEAGEFYGNDNFAVKLNAEQRRALRDFVAELRPNKD